jgi:hypothetical protein
MTSAEIQAVHSIIDVCADSDARLKLRIDLAHALNEGTLGAFEVVRRSALAERGWPYQEPSAARRLVDRTCIAQELPLVVEDPETVRRVNHALTTESVS